jgi:hypothetical protein
MVIGRLSRRVRSSLSNLAQMNNGQNITIGEATGTGTNRGGVVMDLERNIKTPADRDILLGRGRTSWSHTGNQQFRLFIGVYLKKYTESRNRSEKTKTVHLIYDEIVKAGGRFLKLDSSTDTWYQVEKAVAREKIAHTLRDAIGLRIKLTVPDGDDNIERKFAGGPVTQMQKSKKRSITKTITATPSATAKNPQPFERPPHELFVGAGGAVPEDTISCEEVMSCGTMSLSATASLSTAQDPPHEAMLPDKHTLDKERNSRTKTTEQTDGKNRVAAAAATQVASSAPAISAPQASLPNLKAFAPLVTDDEHAQDDDKKSLHLLVNSMLAEMEHLGAKISDEDQTSVDHSVDDEISTGLSAMSLDTGGKSRTLSRTSRTLSRTGSEKKDSKKSAIFQLSQSFCTSRGSIISKSGPSSTSSNHLPASDGLDVAHADMLLRQRGKVASSLFNGDGVDDFELDVTMGAASLDWTKGPLDDFSLSSTQSKSTKNSRKHNKPTPPPPTTEKQNDNSTNGSEISTETEKEWRKTLRALRGT